MNNTVFVVGHVGQNPKVKVFDTGKRLANFSIAVKEYSANLEEPITLWFDVDAWEGLAERVQKTITKGREVVLSGRLSMTTYTKEENGIKMQITKPVIKLTSFTLCGKKPTVNQDTQIAEIKEESKPKKKSA